MDSITRRRIRCQAARIPDVSGEPGWRKPSLGASLPQKASLRADPQVLMALVSSRSQKKISHKVWRGWILTEDITPSDECI